MTSIDRALINRKAIFAWCLYDWGNSSYSSIIMTFIFSTYFTQKVAINKIIGTAQWANANTIAGILIALLGPILGAMVDLSGRRKPWIAFFVTIAVLTAAGLWFITPQPKMVYLMLFLFIIGTTSLEIAFIFYNALLYDLSPRNYTGRISGWAWSMGYFGGIVSLTLALVLIETHFSVWPLNQLNQADCEAVRLCGPFVALWLSIFTLPLFFFVNDRAFSHLGCKQMIVKSVSALVNLLSCWRSKHRVIFKFLLARMIYIDGLNTLFAFAGIYAAGVMHFTLSQVIILGIVLNGSAGIGAMILAWLDDFRGPKLTILVALSVMIFFGFFLLVTHDLIWFWIFSIGISLGVGPVQAASRSLMIRLVSKEILTESFGLFAFSGKATAFLGPFVLGVVTFYTHSQRMGMATIFIFFLIGLLLLLGVSENRVLK